LRRSRLSLAALLAAATSAAVVAVPAVAYAAPKDVTVQLLAMNDFHGRITPQPSPGDGQLLTSPGADDQYGTPDDSTITVGGAAQIAATVDRLQASFKQGTQGPSDSLFVGAGDLVSASPFESSVYKDEPTIEALNAMGLDVSSVGNHEFDRGTEELRRISAATDGTYTDDVTACEGITPGVDGCFGDQGHEFHGADFPYLAANVISTETHQPMLPPYQIFTTPAHQKIALIGVVTDTTPTIVSPQGIEDVTFIDEAAAVNKWVPVLQRQGVQAIGVLVHEGGTVKGANVEPDINKCTELTGDIVDLNDRIDNAVDLIVSAHTHVAYNCKLPQSDGQQRLVTQAGYYGRLLTDIRLSIDRRTGDVDRSATYQATNVPVTREAADPDVQAIVDYWNGRAAVPGNVPVGSITKDILAPNGGSQRNREWPLVNLIADTQLYAMRQDPAAGLPQIAFMNPGGVRKSLLYAPDGVITYRELFDVQPFSNTVNTLTLTGAEIDDLLEEQFPHDVLNTVTGRKTQLILGVSKGFTFTYDAAAGEGNRVPDESIKLDGTTIGQDTNYRVVANGFLAPGGDSFDTFKLGTNPYVGMMDVDASVHYFKAFSPIDPTIPPGFTGRSVCTGGCPTP
jgi:5'-nucleotidase